MPLKTMNLQKKLIITGATTATLPEHESKTFYQKPMMAAYYALHMVGIKDDRKMYKEKSREDKNLTLKQALRWVNQENPNFHYTNMTTEDHKRPGGLFANLDQTPQPGLPEIWT